MKTILFIINLVLSLYGTSPIFITLETLPKEREGQIYITVDYGICLDDSGNGKLYSCDSGHDYISYSGVKNAISGDKIYTFCIMNPDSDYWDDIICRIDVIEDSGEISINMDDMESYSITEYGIQLNFDDETGYYWEW